MNKRLMSLSLTAAAVLATSGCFHDDDDNGTTTQALRYQVSLTNLTNGQPMSPVAMVLHTSGYTAFETGAMASLGIEKLAEGGDSTDLIADAQASTAVVDTAVAGAGPFMPGNSVMADLESQSGSGLMISVAAMLGNTNDAFAGANGVAVPGLAVGQSHSMLVHAYDAGTEANTESTGTIPGPADGGTGFDMARDEYAAGSDYVSIHRGVVTVDDGLSSSVLDESHRWLGPVAKLTVMRIQ